MYSTIIYLASAAVALILAIWLRHHPLRGVDSVHHRILLTGTYVSTMWFMVRRWLQSQEGDWARPHLCKLARHGPWPMTQKWRGRWKPGCRILTTEADDQSSLHYSKPSQQKTVEKLSINKTISKRTSITGISQQQQRRRRQIIGL